MRAVLISLGEAGDENAITFVGKSVCQRQLDFARAWGCEEVILHGLRTSRNVAEMRRYAEKQGLRFHSISSAHSIAGLVGETGDLLVLQPGLLPLSPELLHALRDGHQIAVASAPSATRAGFERIDVENAWAGALTLPASLLKELERLPEDCAPAPSLLRIALQARLPLTKVSEELLSEGDWKLVQAANDADVGEKIWVGNALERRGIGCVSGKIANASLQSIGGRLAMEPRAKLGSAAFMILLLVIGAIVTWSGFAWAGFLLIALSVPVAQFAIGLARLETFPFGKVRGWPLLAYAADLAIFLSGFLAIESFAYRQAFAPLVLAISLLLLDRRALLATVRPARDRGVIAALLALGTAFASPELVIMLVATAVLATNLAPQAKAGG